LLFGELMAADKSFKSFDVKRVALKGKAVPMQRSRKVFKSVVHLPTQVACRRNVVKGGPGRGGRSRKREQHVNALGINSTEER
jgi:hypothetical protein